jgi:hypothetical protein
MVSIADESMCDETEFTPFFCPLPYVTMRVVKKRRPLRRAA